MADVEDGVGAPIMAQIPPYPSIARSVDAGLLAAWTLPEARLVADLLDTAPATPPVSATVDL